MKKLVSNHEFLCKHHTSSRYEGIKHSYDLMLTCADSDFKIPLVILAVKYNVFIISDEIWQDIVSSNVQHHPLFSFNSPAINQVLVLSFQTKTYNLEEPKFVMVYLIILILL